MTDTDLSRKEAMEAREGLRTPANPLSPPQPPSGRKKRHVWSTTTGDPAFDPAGVVEVNGYWFVAAGEVERLQPIVGQLKAAAQDWRHNAMSRIMFAELHDKLIAALAGGAK